MMIFSRNLLTRLAKKVTIKGEGSSFQFQIGNAQQQWNREGVPKKHSYYMSGSQYISHRLCRRFYSKKMFHIGTNYNACLSQVRQYRSYSHTSTTNTNESEIEGNKLRGRLFKNRILDEKIESMIRVNQAGEQGAVVIANGQKFVFGNDPTVDEILCQEMEHKRDFTKMARERRIRPTILSPVWHVVGFGLGVVSAALGRKTAMVVHEAVEDVIADHYNEQLRTIHEIARELAYQEVFEKGKDPNDDALLLESQRFFEKELRALITKCRNEEIHHKELAVENHSRDAPMYTVLYNAISAGCKSAVWLSKRI